MENDTADRNGPERDEPMPSINPETVCYVIVKARAYEAKEEVIEPDPGSNPADDSMIEVLEAYPDDPVFDELKAFIEGLTEDAQVELVALTWVGRGDHGREEWEEAVALARQRHNERTADYLLGMPLLPDYLEEGLAQFGLSCEDFEFGHL